MSKPATIAQLTIRHVITPNDFYGEPWPPNEPGLWVTVRRLPLDFTQWRSIQLEEVRPPPSASQP